jgi:hypothetical protein
MNLGGTKTGRLVKGLETLIVNSFLGICNFGILGIKISCIKKLHAAWSELRNEQRLHPYVVVLGFFGKNFLSFEKLTLKIDISKDGGGTLDVFAIRMMLVKAIL